MPGKATGRRPRHRTLYDQRREESDAATASVNRAGGPYAAPEELVDRSLEAARRLWAARGRIRRRR